MAVNQKAISTRIDYILLAKLEEWCVKNNVKRNTAINMGIASLLENGVPKVWR